MTHIITFLFLVSSAVGATIILSRGDIFKPFREWLNNMAIKKKLFVHDLEIINPIFERFCVDGNYHSINNHNGHDIGKFIAPDLRDFISSSKEKTNLGTRYFIECESAHSIFLIYAGGSTGTFNVYPKLIYRPIVKYISDLLGCPQCAGLWVGMLWFILFKIGLMQYWWFLMFCTGCIVSLAAYLYFKVYTWLEKK